MTGESVSRRTYLGLFLTTLSTLMFEILLTRIFSVTLWYHFAFLAISVAMLGMTIGAIFVYLRPDLFPNDRVHHRMSDSAGAFAITLVAAVIFHAALPSNSGLRLPLTFVVTTVPFFFSGICVCLALTRFPKEISRLYAIDLAGAALGCLLLIAVLEWVDGISAVFVCGALAALGALILVPSEFPRLKRIMALVLVALGLFAAVNNTLSHLQRPLFGLRWVKMGFEGDVIYEKWNAFSRITVRPGSDLGLGWGISSTYNERPRVNQLWLQIDALAGTVLTNFEGDFESIDYLRYDITNLAHHLRQDRSQLVIGAGGGRDVLSALLFGQRQVTAVELNHDILKTVHERFGDFTGHLDKIPNVRYVNDEARSWIARQDEKFGLIQISWIDTWAATAAGAFALTENSLYTVDAWKSFLEHLEPDGILTVSRYYQADLPIEATRTTELARQALFELGVERPEEHILLAVRGPDERHLSVVPGNATILVSPTPFSNADVNRFLEVTDELAFGLGYAPGHGGIFDSVARGQGVARILQGLPIRVDAPTDDSPFFFNSLKVKHLFDSEVLQFAEAMPNLRAVTVLVNLLATVVLLTVLFVFVPLFRASTRPSFRGNWALLLFFAAIGVGFMMIEISQMQRLMVFLGHPTYGLGVVLFSLLISSGLGSLLTDRIPERNRTLRAIVILTVLVAVLIGFGLLTDTAIQAFASSSTPIRATVAVAILFPLGLLMGMPFPLGMRTATERSPSLTPWLWGINGSTSVTASVLAIVVALEFGISVSYWVGAGAYVLATLALLQTVRGQSLATG